MSATVRVQLARIAGLAACAQADGLAWLTAAEQQRLQAISDGARRDSYLAGHWQVRQLAAQWLQLDAGRIALGAHVDGRPLLRVDGQPTPLHVSLSHSGEWLALALADAPVGVDIELPQRPRDWLALARFVFSPEERQQLQDVEDAARADVFHVLWTLKEARGKRGGEGLQPRAARSFTACSCEQENAEAVSWRVGNGALALALALAAGAQIVLDAEAAAMSAHAPSYWRYRQQPLQEIGDNSGSR